MPLRPLIVALALLIAVSWCPAAAGAHGGPPGGGPHPGRAHAAPAVSALVLLGVPAVAIAAGALGLRRAVRRG